MIKKNRNKSFFRNRKILIGFDPGFATKSRFFLIAYNVFALAPAESLIAKIVLIIYIFTTTIKLPGANMSFDNKNFGVFISDDEFDEFDESFDDFADDESDETLDSYDEDSESYEEAFEDDYDIDEPFDDVEAEDGYQDIYGNDGEELSDDEDDFFDEPED